MSIIINPAYKCPINKLNEFILEIEKVCKDKMIEKIQVMAQKLLERGISKDDLEKELSESIKKGFINHYSTNPHLIESGVNIFLDKGFAYIVPYDDAREFLYDYPLLDYVENFSYNNQTESYFISYEEAKKGEKWNSLWIKNKNPCMYERSFTTAHPRIMMFYQLIDEAIKKF